MTYNIAITGHRPDKIGGYNPNNELRKRIRGYIKDNLINLKSSSTQEIHLLTGGALGVDQDAALIAIDLDIPYTVAIPCSDFGNNWPKPARDNYSYILDNSSKIISICDTTYYQNPSCYEIRNKWLVDNSGLILGVWDGSNSGTKNCLKYAKKIGRDGVVILFDKKANFSFKNMKELVL